MTTQPIDLRSDTVTRPTPAMRAAMAAAPVGDDVMRDDPTINLLEERVASLLGKEAAMYVPSGTMSNLICVRVHCRPGDAFICEANCHIYIYEQAGYAQINGVAARAVVGNEGVLTIAQLEELSLSQDMHFPRTRLFCLENTHNRGGGRVLSYETVAAQCDWAHRHGLITHLDGARLWNAVVATGVSPARWAAHFDTVSVCFSKGLGAPVGSALVGPADLISEARRHRKVLGGGMRQAGVIAAGALYALEHHIDRLAEDHANAQRLADGVRQIAGLSLARESVDTNIVFIGIDAEIATADAFSKCLAKQGLLMNASLPRAVRAVTHLDITAADIDRALEILARTVAEYKGKAA